MAEFCLCREVGQVKIGIGARHDVGVMVLDEVVAHTFCHAAEYAEDAVMGAQVLGMEGIEPVVDFVLGILAYRTGVEKHGIRLCGVVGDLIACHLHHRGHHLAVGDVHLASVGFDI